MLVARFSLGGTWTVGRVWKVPCGIVYGLLNRWTSQYDWGIMTGGLIFNLNNGTKTLLIIVKISENTFLGMTKVRAGPILTLAMP